jgi:6-phosphofructokinase 1
VSSAQEAAEAAGTADATGEGATVAAGAPDNVVHFSRTQTVTQADLEIRRLGTSRIDSPMLDLLDARQTTEHYVDEDDRVLLDDTVARVTARGVPVDQLPGMEPCGPRRKIYFDPSKTRVGIVTCGGLCPGLNDVIAGLVRTLTYHYGVRRIVGFRNGYQGFISSYGYDEVELTPQYVRDIATDGGTVLGTSRGHQDHEEIVDCLERMHINILFVIGGDGSMRGAMGIERVIAERNLKIAVVGVPKTIDNDIPYIDQSFGFQTAFSRASDSIRAVTVEAKSTANGIGLVKLMGRHSGFIACYAALARSDADVVLIPEVPFVLQGDTGLLAHLRRRVEQRGHAVVVVAEGAGQELLEAAQAERTSTDASGNRRLGDVGRYLRDRIEDHFAEAGVETSVRYIDPSYAIRSVPANPYDSVYTVRLSQAAVHAAMSGRTAMVVGRVRRRFVHIPMTLAVSKRNQVDPHGDLWQAVLESTGQPVRFGA